MILVWAGKLSGTKTPQGGLGVQVQWRVLVLGRVSPPGNGLFPLKSEKAIPDTDTVPRAVALTMRNLYSQNGIGAKLAYSI